ncbi:MAG: protease pro-enzyme activation domain-containing protein, partial [Acidobacteriaceae bacterium]
MHSSSNNSPRVAFPYTDRKLSAAARVVGPTPAAAPVRVSVIVKRKQPLDLAGLQGRHVSREEFSSKYAADPAAFDRLRAFATQHGLSVDENASSLDRRTLVLTGTAEQMQQAFQTELQQVEHEGRQYRIHTQAISLPAEYAPLVDAVLGLDTRPQAQSHLRKLKGLRPAAVGAQSYLPRQVAEFYSFPLNADGSGET